MGGLLNSLVLLDDGCKEDIIVFDVVDPSVVVNITVEYGLVETLGEDVNTVVAVEDVVEAVVEAVVVVVVDNSFWTDSI